MDVKLIQFYFKYEMVSLNLSLIKKHHKLTLKGT